MKVKSIVQKVLKSLWIALKISWSNHTLFGIFIRDKRYGRKEEDGSERYTTCERLYFAFIYATTLLCFNLTIAIIVSSLNANCESTRRALTSCSVNMSFNASFPYNCNSDGQTIIGPFEWNNTRPLDLGDKSLSFADEISSKDYFVYAYDGNLSAVSKDDPKYHSFISFRDSFVCVPDPKDPSSKAYCLHPKMKCSTSTALPNKFDQEQLTKYVLANLVTILFSNIALYILFTPITTLLRMALEGYCEPAKGTKGRTIYKVVVTSISILCLLLLVFWVAIAVWLMAYYFTNVTKRSKIQTFLTTLVSWILTITIVELAYGFVTSVIWYPKPILWRIEPGSEEEITEVVPFEEPKEEEQEKNEE